MRLLRAPLFALCAVLAIAAPARALENDAPLVFDAARPAVGDWVGQVSWSDPRVSYAWSIFPDGSFSSGRFGRGHDGGGAWSMIGGVLTLKYEDGFRYEGALEGDAYSGTAYRADGLALGTFVMWRGGKGYEPSAALDAW